MRSLLRDPLVHFLCIGGALFLLYFWVSPPRPQAPGARIEITADDLRQIDLAWMAKWQRLPTPAERRDLVEAKIREEVLYREAAAMGMDQDDVIVKRRLGQKLEFLLEDVSTIRDPTEAELESWYESNAAQFATPGRVTFRHIYFSPDLRGQHASADASRALAKLNLRAASVTAGVAAIGDRFSDQQYYANRSPDEVSSVFGTQFSQSLFKLSPGRWQGPIESGLGWHLVWIEALTPGRVPDFSEVDRAQVMSAWVDSRRAEAKRKAYEAMRAKYEIVLPPASRP